MAYPKTKLVEEDNTIYEIDLDCMRKKEQKRQQIRYREQKNQEKIKKNRKQSRD